MGEFVRIADDIFVLKGAKSSNIYLLDFDKKILIDTGHPLDVQNNIDAFKNNGFDLLNIDYIINTHSHGDHIGANAYLKKKNPDIRIAAHPALEMFNKVRGEVQVLKGAEVESEVYKADIFLNDKDVMDAGNEKLVFYHTPGHTIDSLVIYIRERNIMFSGDLIYNKVISQLDYYQDLRKSLEELKKSYEKVMEINPAILYPGHGGEITDNTGNLNVLLRKIRRMENNTETIIINTFIPSAEFYIFNNQGATRQAVKDYFYENMLKFKKMPFYIGIEDDKFLSIIDRMLDFMVFLKILENREGRLHTVNPLNYYLSVK